MHTCAQVDIVWKICRHLSERHTQRHTLTHTYTYTHTHARKKNCLNNRKHKDYVQVWDYAKVRLCKSESMKVGRCASVGVCKYEIIKVQVWEQVNVRGDFRCLGWIESFWAIWPSRTLSLNSKILQELSPRPSASLPWKKATNDCQWRGRVGQRKWWNR